MKSTSKTTLHSVLRTQGLALAGCGAFFFLLWAIVFLAEHHPAVITVGLILFLTVAIHHVRAAHSAKKEGVRHE